MPNVSLKSLFAYKAWANSELLASLNRLSSEHADTVTTCIRTLNHIYFVDKIFQAHLSGKANPYKAPQSENLPSLSELQSQVADCDKWYIHYLSQVSEDELAGIIHFMFTDGDKGCMSREEILMHIITHGCYHRGNVGQLLRSISITPPRDLYTKFLHLSEPERRGY